MITHKCDVCNQDIAERFVVVIDNKEHDLCKACKAKTVGKVKNGRAVAQPIQYVPWYVQPNTPWHWDYYKPTWIGTPNTDTPYPEPAKIWCGNDTVTTTTTPAPSDSVVYCNALPTTEFSSGYVEILN